MDTDPIGGWTRALLAFESLIGAESWHRRTTQLFDGCIRSPFDAKIASDYYWVELELAEQLDILRRVGHLFPDAISLRAAAALEFARGTSDVLERLTPRGERVLKGRLKAGLNSGFAGLFLEIDIVSQLINSGYEVEFPDFDGTGTHDFDAIRDHLSVAIECKSLSADAGRKIHRRDFYRFMISLQPKLLSMRATDAGAIIVTVSDRFPTSRPEQDAITRLVGEVIDMPLGRSRSAPGFTVHTERIEFTGPSRDYPADDPANRLRERYGQNAHIAGLLTARTGRIVVAISEREDDPSREALAARKAAARQLPADRPGVVAIQYEEVTAQDMGSSAFRQKLELLDGAFYQDLRAGHVIGLYHCPFDGLWEHGGELGKPALSTWRTLQHAASAPEPFRAAVNNVELARILNIP